MNLDFSQRPPNLTHVEDCLWIADTHIGLGLYDFKFSDFFACTHPTWVDQEVRAVARLGAAPDYAQRYKDLLKWGIRLVHTPEEYQRTSTLPVWYPLIQEWTPKSLWFDHIPHPDEIEPHFSYPIFLKGERQTHKHNRRQSIIENRAHLTEILDTWKRDPILHWQRVVCRAFHPLRPVVADSGAGMPISYEFRTFWWNTTCVGIGPYWTSTPYRATPNDIDAITRIGHEVASRINVAFLVIDIAQTAEGEWIVIECNDGQDSGYMGVDRRAMWSHIVRLQKQPPKG